MTYEQALDYIHSATRLGSRLGLERIRELMRRLGDPQKKLRFVHVAGTNGKGSTVAMTAAVFRAAGLKTGMYISPFVVDFCERMQINGENIPHGELARAVEALVPTLEQMKAEGMECTEFEIVTAAALWWFAAQQCDVVAFEVGLGGRFDATNVIDAPACCAIASISLDHTEFLGDTTGKIAFEKCGILKKGTRLAAYAALPDDAHAQVLKSCAELVITPNFPDLAQLTVLSCGAGGSEIVYKGAPYRISLVGEHQIMNALTVLSIFEELNAAGWGIAHEHIAFGLAHTGFGGRLETVREHPLCMIDGAHNRDAVDMLCRALDGIYANRRIICVMGMLRDKDYAYCIGEVAKRAQVFLAAQPDSPRALDAETAAACARQACPEVKVCADPYRAAKSALVRATEGDLVLACGSLYMIGEARRAFLDTKD
ncbi:MAG: hypothetical protein ABT01_07075 [Clostridium sp. SCN 57-10]|nr:MAG: hypothetical protein ABT01_07075 [Clostridium sp. SCN 57-10]